MRKKMLLVGAFSHCIGPIVHLENGQWKVEEIIEDIIVNLRIKGGEEFVLGNDLILSGPCLVQAELISGENISLSMIQVSRA